MAEEGVLEVSRDARVPLVIWHYVTGEDVNLEHLAWDRLLEGWMRRELGRWGRVGFMARRFHGVSWYEDAQFLVGINLSPPQTRVNRGSGGGQRRRRQWADTRCDRL